MSLKINKDRSAGVWTYLQQQEIYKKSTLQPSDQQSATPLKLLQKQI